MKHSLIASKLATDLMKELDLRKHETLDSHGFIIFENRLSKDFCFDAINDFEELLQNDIEVEKHYQGTEKRIFDFEKHKETGKIFKELSDNLILKISAKYKFKSILAMKNTPLPKNELELGRWHIDSFNNQYKLFCFLEDVKENSGALEIIPFTHKWGFKILNGIFKKEYFSLMDFMAGDERKYTKLRESFISRLLKKGLTSEKLHLQEGTMVLCNTSMIHRSSPCKASRRYSLTSYYS